MSGTKAVTVRSRGKWRSLFGKLVYPTECGEGTNFMMVKKLLAIIACLLISNLALAEILLKSINEQPVAFMYPTDYAAACETNSAMRRAVTSEFDSERHMLSCFIPEALVPDPELPFDEQIYPMIRWSLWLATKSGDATEDDFKDLKKHIKALFESAAAAGPLVIAGALRPEAAVPDDTMGLSDRGMLKEDKTSISFYVESPITDGEEVEDEDGDAVDKPARILGTRLSVITNYLAAGRIYTITVISTKEESSLKELTEMSAFLLNQNR